MFVTQRKPTAFRSLFGVITAIRANVNCGAALIRLGKARLGKARLGVARLGMAVAIILPLVSGCSGGKEADRYFDVSTEGAYSIRFSPDNRQCLVGGLYHGGSLWRLAPIDRLYDWNHKENGKSSITASDFSHDGRYVATTDTRTIALWDRKTGESVWYWNAPADIKDIALTRSGRYALLAMDDYTITLFDIQNGGVKRRYLHDGIVYDVSLNERNSLMASASDDLTAAVWDVESGKRLHSFKHTNQVLTAEISPSGSFLVTSAYRLPAQLWNVETGQLIRSFGNTRGHYSAIAFSDNEQYILTGNTAGQVQLWNLRDGTLIETWRASSEEQWVHRAVHIEDVAFGEGNYFAAGANGRLYWFSK